MHARPSHDHHHEHGHDHSHDLAHVDHHLEAHRPHDEAVVLEIGEELGALVVYTDASLLHTEIEISPAGADDDRSHKDVLERVVAGRSFYAAVFDKLPRGSYTLWHEGAALTRGAAIVGGTVAEVDWTTRRLGPVSEPFPS
jgi:hypothetical protein